MIDRHSLALGLQLLAGLLLVAGAWSDLKQRIIPHRVCLGLALIGLLLRLADASWAGAAGLTLLTFAIMTGFWRFGLVGGGDVKLLAGCMLLVPPAGAAALLVAVSLCGGLLALAYLGLGAAARHRRRHHRPPGPARPRFWPRRLLRIEAWRARRRAGLPYGCAIALGTMIAVLGH